MHSVGIVYGSANSSIASSEATVQAVAVGALDAVITSLATVASSNVTLRVDTRSMVANITANMLTRAVYSGDPVVMLLAELWTATAMADVVPETVRLQLEPVTPSGGATPPSLCTNISAECAPRGGSNACLLSARVPQACFLGGAGQGQTLVGTIVVVGRQQTLRATVGPLATMPSFPLATSASEGVAHGAIVWARLPRHSVTPGAAFSVELWMNSSGRTRAFLSFKKTFSPSLLL